MTGKDNQLGNREALIENIRASIELAGQSAGLFRVEEKARRLSFSAATAAR
jgi:hypothetical protein